MTPHGAVGLFSTVIVCGSLLGAAIPLLGRPDRKGVALLAFAAGVMFGAVFFDLLPEAFRSGGYPVFSFLPLGFLAIFLIERFVLAHGGENPEVEAHIHRPVGLTAFVGLSAHTLFDGIALASAAVIGVGGVAFLAVAAHKIPASVSLASILRSEGRARRQILAWVSVFALMVPLGALLYFGLEAIMPFRSYTPKALAFSAGNFLYIAVADLLPTIQRESKTGPAGKIASFAVGLAVMFGLSLVREA